MVLIKLWLYLAEKDMTERVWVCYIVKYLIFIKFYWMVHGGGDGKILTSQP